MALRQGAVGQAGVVYYLHTDHLGSTSEVSTATASLSGRERYFPYGQVRYTWGSLPTTYTFTGQRLDGTGLLDYGARYYDPLIGRFLSADSIVPGAANPQAFNRYSYVLNNPLRYTDPSGHCAYDADGNIIKWDCTVEEFDAMSIEQRIVWLEQFMKQTDCKECFQNILGVLDFFTTKGFATSGSWVSIVDASILQSYSHGWGLKIGAMTSSSNWGALGWKKFFEAHDPSSGVSRSQQRQLWGDAEQAATDYGVWCAFNCTNPRTGQSYGLLPSSKEAELILVTNVYRGGAAKGAGDSIPLFNPFWNGQRGTVTALAVNLWDDNYYGLYKTLWPYTSTFCPVGCPSSPMGPVPPPFYLP